MARELPLSGEIQRIMQFARSGAIRLNHRTISTEHLLLGLLQTNDPIVTTVFTHLNVTSGQVREAIEFVIGKGNKGVISEPAFTEAVQLIINFAQHEARSLRSLDVRPNTFW
jgi:ATP-dependent Clp protease ATP-binding subunit ClpC